MTQRRVENTRVHFWTFSLVSVKLISLAIISFCKSIRRKFGNIPSKWDGLQNFILRYLETENQNDGLSNLADKYIEY